MENCLVTKLKGTVDNSDFRFDYLDGFIVDFKAGQTMSPSLTCIARSNDGNVTIHVVKGTLYSNETRTTEITSDDSFVNTGRTYYPSLTEETVVVIYNKKAIGSINVRYGTIKCTNYNGLINIANIVVAGGNSGGAFIEGTTELEYFVKTFYNNKILSGITTFWDKSAYSTGLVHQFNTSQVKVNSKTLSYNEWKFFFIPTTNESPVTGQIYQIKEGPVEVYQGNNNEHVLTYDPSTDEFTYYGRFV